MKPPLLKPRPIAADARDLAADWVTREDRGTLRPDEAAARDAWLAQDPRHVAAYDSATDAMRAVEAHAADPRILALRQAALSLKAERRVPAWRIAAAAACAMVLAGGGLALVGERPVPRVLDGLTHVISPANATYRTQVGERSTVTLPDGSVATLNTNTVLKVAYTGSTRGVRLVRGQAMFEVAHNRRRPFEVYAADRAITALGTVFDVRLEGQGVKVALVEGKVRVRPRTAPEKPAAQIVMSPGEVLEARPARAMVVRNVDIARETSWRSGVVVFDETPLAKAVAELNRYSTDQLVIEDTSLAALHVTGVFKTGDLVRFARTVEEILPVTTQVQPGGKTMLARRPQSISPGG